MIDYKRVRPGQKLELYVKATCPYCAQARQYYDGEGVPYVVHDAEHDASARDRMFALAGGDPTVPAIVVDGTYVRSGWGDPPRG
jgi:glutaredoxin 3